MGNSTFFYGNEQLELRNQLENGGGGGGGVTPEQFNELKIKVEEAIADLSNLATSLVGISKDANMGKELAVNISEKVAKLNDGDLCVTPDSFYHLNTADAVDHKLLADSIYSMRFRLGGGMMPVNIAFVENGGEFPEFHYLVNDEYGDVNFSITNCTITATKIEYIDSRDNQKHSFAISDQNNLTLYAEGMWCDELILNGASVKRINLPYTPETPVILDTTTVVAKGEEKRVKVFNSATHFYSDLSFDDSPEYIKVNIDSDEYYVFLPPNARNLRVTLKEVEEYGTKTSYLMIRNYGNVTTNVYAYIRCNHVPFGAQSNAFFTFKFNKTVALRTAYVNVNP